MDLAISLLLSLGVLAVVLIIQSRSLVVDKDKISLLARRISSSSLVLYLFGFVMAVIGSVASSVRDSFMGTGVPLMMASIGFYAEARVLAAKGSEARSLSEKLGKYAWVCAVVPVVGFLALAVGVAI